MENSRELIAFTRHLYYITKMGAPLLETMEKIKNDIKDSRLKKAVEDMEGKLEEGESFSGAIRSHPDVFPLEYARMIEVAEKTDSLPQVLSDLSVYLESVEKSRKNMRAASLYPGLVLNFSLLFILVINRFVSKEVLYLYVQTADKVGWGISPFVKFFVEAGRFIFSPVFLIAMAVLIVLMDIMLFTRTSLGTNLLLKLPLVRDIFQKAYTVRICRSLGYMLKQGITCDNAVDMLSETIESNSLKKLLKNGVEELRRGTPLSKALGESKFFENTMIFMVKNGEEKEKLPEALFEAADYYEEDLNNFYKGLFHFVEPAFLITVGLVVGFMVVSLLTPFYFITGAIH